jgi:hypothetical protein
MPLPRKTDRGRATESLPPLTLKKTFRLLRKVIKRPNQRCALGNPAMTPTITHLMQVVNILQFKRLFPHEGENLSMAAHRRMWSPWISTGIMPAQRRFGTEPNKPAIQPHDAGHIELGPGRSPLFNVMDVAAMAIEQEPPAERAHVYKLMCGNDLLARSIKHFTDYAPDLRRIFDTELCDAMKRLLGEDESPDPGDEAAFRFIAETASIITGESGITPGAVKKALARL